ncbi:MAG: monovalent cation/H+ antiporter subunit D family protein [Alphaproteobacteria bacterium]|nr:monovalent cation/H+ antiporter subunit D family protein [Alphaproteobacteria bacterium]
MSAHLPALQVVVPLVAAPLCLLAGRAGLAWIIAFTASVAATAIAATLAYLTFHNGVIHYDMGGWAPPWGIEYVVDTANAFILLLVSAIATVVLAFSPASIAKEIRPGSQHLFYCMFILCLTGLLGITVTGDAFNVFVFLEISSLSSYALIALGGQRKALTAAFQYLVMGTIGATFFLIGVGLLYMMTGTLNMADMQARIPALQDSRPVLAAFAFITVGLALKAALFPLHLWLPNAYAYAPSAVSAFLAATATKVSLYVLLRFTFTIFGAKFAFLDLPLHWALLAPAVIAMFAGSFTAIFQRDIKRMLAYSSIAQIGYITLAISLASSAGIAAALIHIFNHGLIKAALFCAMGCIFYRIGSTRIENMAGLGQQMPWTMTAIIIAGLSLLGVPLTAGFISKWYLVQATLQADLWWLVLLIALSSMLALVYVWRLVETMYFKDPPPGREAAGEAPLSMLLPTLLLAGANIYFGLDTRLPVSMAESAAALLLRGQLP